jgi:hypothetical protein
MRIDEELYSDIKKAQEKTLTNYDEEIIWKDAENIDGYITSETLACIVRDLIIEIDNLEEKIEDLENKNYEDPYSYEAWENHKLEEEYR